MQANCGSGHLQINCPNKKNRAKAKKTTMSDNESNCDSEGSEEYFTSHVMLKQMKLLYINKDARTVTETQD